MTAIVTASVGPVENCNGRATVGSSVLYMSMSADGFVTGPNVRPDNAMGDGGLRLHQWVFPNADPGDMAATTAGLTGIN